MFNRTLFLLLLLSACSAPDNATRIKELDEKIEQLKEERYQFMVDEIDIETDSQSAMIGEWEVYAKRMEEVKKLREEENRILNQIIQLHEERIKLMESSKK